jgi:hypothetical protein
LQKDCEITGAFYNEGKTCAVGCLALLAGVPHEELEPLKVDGEIVMRRVADYFGLRLDDIDQIITLNDEIETWEPDHVQKRRDNVVEFIKTLWEETNPVPL